MLSATNGFSTTNEDRVDAIVDRITTEIRVTSEDVAAWHRANDALCGPEPRPLAERLVDLVRPKPRATQLVLDLRDERRVLARA